MTFFYAVVVEKSLPEINRNEIRICFDFSEEKNKIGANKLKFD